ncbi:hypothetical protein CN305_12220 [Bacillus cereus]|uniref:DUF4062 domain-containing protein n=1 Tax=Bacillus cereus TaxID=1396 RepID=UPI000BF5C170|nr:DUF4062 domain-containing protein [Bacillus cereus]PFD19712.1 hypothetical protein CN305_12220 [Bacillus cereus]PFR78033.1 hypothetical protein COK40_04755 [Bacillus cereus]
MKPRVFVSSTYYDLKHIRNNMERFIEQYGFDPVLFESGNVTFEYSKQLDESCYNEVKLCNMMILIIGGRYGSRASETDNAEEFEKYVMNYEKNYVSITRKEFRTAQEMGIPIFIFIEKNVYAEYYTFNKNKDFFVDLYNKMVDKTKKNKKEKNEIAFDFAHVDSMHIFEFIDEVKMMAIQTFEKFDDIEEYLKNQWAGMFYLYLDEQLKKKRQNKVLDAVAEIKVVSEKMNEMLNEVGKKLLGDNGEYEEVIQRQNKRLISYFAKSFASGFSVYPQKNNSVVKKTYQENQNDYKQLVNTIIEEYLDDSELQEKLYEKDLNWDFLGVYLSNIEKKFDEYNLGVNINKYKFVLGLNSYYKDIKPIITKNEGFKEYLNEEISNNLLNDVIFFNQ